MFYKIIILFTVVFLSNPIYAENFIENYEIKDRQPINEPIKGYNPEINSYPDPYPDDKILLVIDKDNFNQFAETILTPGQLEMFKLYPETFKMNVYESRRSCSVPPEVYQLTKENALLIDEGEGIKGVVGSIPFPNPTEALHHVWNHILRFRGVEIYGSSPFFIINPDGSRTYGAGEAIAKNFWNPFTKNDKGLQGMIMIKVTHPPRLADASALIIASTLSEFIKSLHTLAASSGFALLSRIISSIFLPSNPPALLNLLTAILNALLTDIPN